VDKSKKIFGNNLSERTYKKAVKTKRKYMKKFGDDSKENYPLKVIQNKTLTPFIGVENVVIGDKGDTPDFKKGVIVGNIRMGYGHYRISMAIASAANSMGYTPYWFDLNSFGQTTGGKVINHLNSLYSLGSRLSQKYSLFNKFYWEPLNSKGFKKLSYNSGDQKTSELMTSVFKNIPKEIPFIATHAWLAQAAVHAEMKKVVNVIPDNWPMALHLAEGSIHTLQTPSSYLGYRTLKGMDGDKVLNPIPEDEIYYTGHYVDHEIVSNIEVDCKKRLERIKKNKAKRILLTVGGAGAQKEIFEKIITHLLPSIEKNEAVLYINIGDHIKVWENLKKSIPQLEKLTTLHWNNWEETTDFTENALNNEISGIHLFYNEDIFPAVYGTNLLMRSSDILITKPSELSFYPVPKLLIKRIGGHEKWGAVRASEIGDGSLECETTERSLQMLDLMLKDRDILTMFNQNILKAWKIGVYNGAYKVVELAVKEENND